MLRYHTYEHTSNFMKTTPPAPLYILQRGMQWKQGVVICMVLYTILLYNTTTPIHCTPLPLHPPLQSIQVCTARRDLKLNTLDTVVLSVVLEAPIPKRLY